MLKFILSVIAASLWFLIGCRESINSSDPSNKTSVKRNYVWEIDTLNLDYFHSITEIWGSSGDDVWAIGTDGFWHFNGTKWTKYGHFNGQNWSAIFGFSPTDIWAATSGTARIYHFDGSDWNLYPDEFKIRRIFTYLYRRYLG